MTEFLIYDQENRMDLPSKSQPHLNGYEKVRQGIQNNTKLTDFERAMNLILFDHKYDTRDQRDDIIEVREAGRKRGDQEEKSFKFVRVPMEFKDAKKYKQKHMDGETKLHKRRFKLDTTGLVFDEHNTADLSVTQFLLRAEDKASGSIRTYG